MGANDAVEKTRLQQMLVNSDDGMIVAVFRRHPGQTLPFIDRYLESGLAMLEKGGPTAQADALASFRMGIKFAALADKAFGDTNFSDYANAFASWSPSEQKSFRDGQRLFKTGMKSAADDKAKAKLLLQQSLARATALGDLWGQAMALGGIAEILLAGSEDDVVAAIDMSMKAAQINSRIQLTEDGVQALRLNAKAHAARKTTAAEVGSLRLAWEILERDASIDDALRATVLEEYVAALDRSSAKDAIPELRRRYEESKAARNDGAAEGK